MSPRPPANRDTATWLQRIAIEGALLDWSSLHGAVAVALRHPDMMAGQLGHARARLALWRDLLGGVLVAAGCYTEAELREAHAGLEDCAMDESEASDSCQCWLAPRHPDDHHCPGDEQGHRMPIHGAHRWA